MGEHSHQSRVVPVHDLRDYFRTSIDDVIAKQGVELDPHAAHYVVNLITRGLGGSRLESLANPFPVDTLQFEVLIIRPRF